MHSSFIVEATHQTGVLQRTVVQGLSSLAEQPPPPSSSDSHHASSSARALAAWRLAPGAVRCSPRFLFLRGTRYSCSLLWGCSLLSITTLRFFAGFAAPFTTLPHPPGPVRCSPSLRFLFCGFLFLRGIGGIVRCSPRLYNPPFGGDGNTNHVHKAAFHIPPLCRCALRDAYRDHVLESSFDIPPRCRIALRDAYRDYVHKAGFDIPPLCRWRLRVRNIYHLFFAVFHNPAMCSGRLLRETDTIAHRS